MVTQGALQLLSTLMEDGGVDEMHMLIDREDFCTLLFEMLSFGLPQSESSAILHALMMVFAKAQPEDILPSLEVGLDNFLSLADEMAGVGRTAALLEWYACLQALLASSACLPDVNDAANACTQGLRVSYSAEVLQACWSALECFSVPGRIEEYSMLPGVLAQSFQVVSGMEHGLIMHEGCMSAFLSWVMVSICCTQKMHTHRSL